MRHNQRLILALAVAFGVGMSSNALADEGSPQTFNAFAAAQQAAQGNVVVVPDAEPRDTDRVVVRRNTPLIVSGLVTFGVAYAVSASVAAATESDANDRLYVPLVGPWLSLADRPDCPIEDESCDGETTAKVLLVVDGVVQGTGVITFIYGLLNPISTTVAGTEVSGLRMKPITVKSGGGLAVSGQF